MKIRLASLGGLLAVGMGEHLFACVSSLFKTSKAHNIETRWPAGLRGCSEPFARLISHVWNHDDLGGLYGKNGMQPE